MHELLGLIEHSSYDYWSPIVLTKKKEVKLTQDITKSHVTVNVFAYIQLTKKNYKTKKVLSHSIKAEYNENM